MLSPPQNPIWKTLLYLLAGLLLLWNLRTLVLHENHFDDAYMFLRYAKVWEASGELGWNVGDRTYGLTSLPYAFFVGAAYQLVPEGWVSGGKFLTLCSFFWGMVGLCLLFRSTQMVLQGSRLDGKNLEWAMVVVLLASTAFRANLLTGMDTTLAFAGNAFLIWTVLHHHRKAGRFTIFLVALAAYLTFSIRPDNGLYAFLFPLLSLYLISNTLKPYTLYLIPFLSLIALDSFARYQYFGHLFPLPFYAKTLGFYQAYLGVGFWEVNEYLRLFLWDAMPLLVPLLLFFHPRRWRGMLPYAAPLLLTLLYYFTVIQIMGDQARFYVPSGPFLFMALWVGLRDSLESEPSPRMNLIMPLLLVPFFMFQGIASARYQGRLQVKAEQKTEELFPLPDSYEQNIFPERKWWASLQGIDRLLAQLPSDITIAATEHGILASEHPETRVVCLIGLHNPDLTFGGLSAETMDQILRQEEPVFVWMPKTSYPELHHAILNADFFGENYQFLPGAYDYGLGINRSSPYFETIMEAVKREYGR